MCWKFLETAQAKKWELVSIRKGMISALPTSVLGDTYKFVCEDRFAAIAWVENGNVDTSRFRRLLV